MKWHPTVLITAGSVNKNGFVFTKEALKKLEDPDKGIRFSHDLYALIKDIPPPPPDRVIKEGDTSPTKTSNPPEKKDPSMASPVNILEVERKDYYYPIIRRLLGIPADEPLFLVRGKDTLSYELVQDYCERGVERGLAEDLIIGARKIQDAIRYHLEAIVHDIPDLPSAGDPPDRPAQVEKRMMAVESLLDEMDRGEEPDCLKLGIDGFPMSPAHDPAALPDKVYVAMAFDELTAHTSPAGFHGGTEIGVYNLVETARVKSLLLDRTPHE